ncbi:MAG: hypothetical protein WD266_09425 [Balneolales bacterium]
MNTSALPYRLLSTGLILLLVASFSAPVLSAVGTACCDAGETGYDCHTNTGENAERCDCTVKQTPPTSGTIESDRVQVNKFAAMVAGFTFRIVEPYIPHTQKVKSFTVSYGDSLPIYLMNRVLLN